MKAQGGSLDIVRNMAAVERLKCALLSDVAGLFEDMASTAGQREAQRRLAGILVDNYLLAERLGIGFDGLNASAAELLRARVRAEGGNNDMSRLLARLSGGEVNGQ